MLSKVKKVFFNSMFALLYISFVAQFVYVVTSIPCEKAIFYVAALSVEWLVLMSARYLVKKSGGQQRAANFNHNRRR